MVVEDEPDIYELLLAMFEMWGIEGVAFVDGEEAAAWIEEADKSTPDELPELALLDIRLPGALQGSDVAARLRASVALKNVAIVLITAYKLTVDEEKTIRAQAQADELLYKPLPKFAELRGILEKTIADRKTAAAAPRPTPPPSNDSPKVPPKESLKESSKEPPTEARPRRVPRLGKS
jgi:CheY-like chemotaxis protein